MLIEELLDERLPRVVVAGKKCLHALAQRARARRQKTLELSSLVLGQGVAVDEPARNRCDLPIVLRLLLVSLIARIASGVEQAKPCKMVLFPELLRRCRQEQEPACGARQSVDELVRRTFFLEMMGFVDDDHVPGRVANLGSALRLVSDPVEAHDGGLRHQEWVGALIFVRRLDGLTVRLVHERKREMETSEHLDEPLVNQRLRNQNQNPRNLAAPK